MSAARHLVLWPCKAARQRCAHRRSCFGARARCCCCCCCCVIQLRPATVCVPSRRCVCIPRRARRGVSAARAAPRSKCSFVFCGHQRCDAAAAVAARRKAWRRARGQRAAATRCRFTRRGRTHLHQMTQGGARGGPRRARALLRRRADALRQGSVFRSQRSAQRRRLRAAATRVHPLQRHAPRGVRRGGGGAETAVANPWRPQRDAARGSSARACTRARPPLAAGLRRGARGIVWAGRAVLAQLTACLSPPGFGTRGLVTQAGSTRARPRAGWVGSGRTRALRARVESGHAREGE